MPDTATSDPTVVIEKLQHGANPYIIYRNLLSGRRWRVDGTCNQCGLCVIGATDATMGVARWTWSGPPGTPYCVTDVKYSGRPDDPVTPEFAGDMVQQAARTPTATVTGCTLTFTVL